uniref:TIR domain-containing protein n=1 Tax=Corethrella appendiculata TaxID=1370023 RepID=U5EVX5_9DIPT
MESKILLSVISCAILLATIVQCYPQFEYRQPPSFMCPTEILQSSKCGCTFAIQEIEIQCPIIESRISVRLTQGSYARVECDHAQDDDFNLIPQLDFKDIPAVQIRRCPLPRRKTIKDITDRLGIKKVTGLWFQSNNIDLGNSLYRQHFKGLTDLQRLVLSSNAISELPADLFNEMKNLSWLELRANKVHLPPDVFNELRNLTVLELGYNKIENTEPGLFKNLHKLNHLNLWGNKLQNLTKLSFEGASGVTELDLSANEIETFNPDVFELLTKLENINLNANHFKELPEGLFEHNKNLSRFKLINNRVQMKSLPSGLFANLTNLDIVQLQCELEVLPENTFEGSYNIRNLTLAQNNISSLAGNVFAHQEKLMDLDLSDNQLSELDDNLFRSTVDLIVLRLSNNHIYNLSANLLGNLKFLRELYLNDNNLHHIDENAFIQQKSLSTLYLQNNFLTLNDHIQHDEILFDDLASGSTSFQYLSDLRILNLRNNRITDMSAVFLINNLKVENVDLSYNNISIINYSNLQILPSGATVNLSHNNIFEINMSALEASAEIQEFAPQVIPAKIYFDHNPLYCNCVIYSFVRYLHNDLNPSVYKLLDLKAENLKCHGPNELANRFVTNLKTNELLCPLDSPQTKIRKCPLNCNCMVRPVDLALIVNCSNLQLSVIPKLPSASGLGLQFIELHVENNNLTKLPLVIGGIGSTTYSQVREIYAQNNSIEKLTAQHLPPNLRILQLENNNLKTMNKSVIEYWNQSRTLESISLSGNPWECKCESLDIFMYIREKFRMISDFNHIKCSDGIKFEVLTKSDLCTHKQVWITAICVTIAILALLIGTLIALYYKYQHEIKVWLYANNLCLFWITEKELDENKIYDAFISYSHKDEDFVTEHLIPTLEKDPYAFKTCWHDRDWVPGEFISVQIAKSVEESKRTIIVLSKNFIESEWGRLEFRTAHESAFNEGRSRVIVIIYGDIGNVDNLDPELKAYLKTNTYVKWGDPWFWKKLIYAMPHSEYTKGLKKNSIKTSVDDKLELIKPIPVTPPPLTTPPAEISISNGILPQFINHTNPSSVTNHYQNGKLPNGITKLPNGYTNGHINNAFVINTNAKQSDV